MITQAWWYYLSTGQAWGARLVACGAFVVAGVAARWVPPLVSVLVLDAILIVLVAVLTRLHRQVLASLPAAREG
ncbi:hypothetical protein ACFYU9_04670 [Streptomyces sp. NPDC004327]|uniref:hypothetical protein n=1 Tax=unclassified Streptomyces TaxID=2593676 RepID=UPI00369BC60C